MKISEAYRMAVEAGIKNDIRPRSVIDGIIKKENEKYESLPEDEKEYFDKERLWNPYADTRISYLPKDAKMERIFWGIDVGPSEMLLADRFREKGEKISAVVAHHTLGQSESILYEVISMQKDVYRSFGVPIKATSKLIDERADYIRLGLHSANYNRAVDAAKLLNIPLMNIHTPADNMVGKFLAEGLEKENPKKMKDIIDYFMTIPEYRISAKYNNKPIIVVGKPSDPCGKVLVKMNGGTSGPEGMYEKFKEYGIGTIIGMHFPKEHVKEAKKHGINMLVSCHMASDSLGVNMICDIWEKKGVEIVPFSGLIRVSRN